MQLMQQQMKMEDEVDVVEDNGTTLTFDVTIQDTTPPVILTPIHVQLQT